MNSIVLEVYLKNLIYNYKLVKKINKKIIVAAVVKSNAYGIGIKTVSENLFKIGCKDFFVATIDEGVELRKLLKYVNIYILNGITIGSLFVYSLNFYFDYNLSLFEKFIYIRVVDRNILMRLNFHDLNINFVEENKDISNLPCLHIELQPLLFAFKNS